MPPSRRRHPPRAYPALGIFLLLAVASCYPAAAGSLADLEEALAAGHYAQALRSARKQLASLPEDVLTHRRSLDDLGLAITYLAVAEAGTGDLDAAFWHGQVARALFPAAARCDLAAFGEAGQALRRPPALPAGSPAPRELDERSLRGGITLPEKLRGADPRFPNVALRGMEAEVTVRLLIATDGHPAQPKLLRQRGDAVLLFLGLEAVRQWTFKPATVQDQPVPALWPLTVSFAASTQLPAVRLSPVAIPTTPPP